ncbi:uncharacterized protein BJ212DRAFT_1298696 [Suillus subaureus]|uniref:AMP-dependent synthetase/ligase domain-containing protein n=1 Tax=Suillus subaureus TaxID=48587 RepID=A0A9P7EE39_9AGAM|nr:uncharacterized protein BJ212DRAFT_1298696 [Suillus subaureus]KAG1818631.1 hypothetical protein BJ212DRAFT_1298696 [Suillus subaureus]
MVSHGNIIHATLGVMVHSMKIDKIQEPPVWDTPDGLQVYFSVLPVYHLYGLYMTSFLNFIKCSTIYPEATVLHTSHLNLLPSFVPVSQAWKELPQVMVCPNLQTVVTMNPLPGMLDGWAKNKPGSARILVSSVTAHILHPNGSLVGPNEAGELHVHGGTAMLGYKANIKATQEIFINGWLHMGDQMRIDEDGDTLKILGMQVSPVEIENTLLAQPDKLITDTQLSRYKWLRGGIVCVEMIPKSPTRKVLKWVLVDEYARDGKVKAKAKARL